MIRKKLWVHNPANSHTRYFRNYNLFWDMLTHELQKKYDVILSPTTENAHMDQTPIKLRAGTYADFYGNETEYIIENERDEFVIFSITDMIHPGLVCERDNPKLHKVFISQYVPKNVLANVGQHNITKYSPWIYFPHSPRLNLEPYFHKRKHITEFTDRMTFRGGTAYRPILNYFSKDVLLDTDSLESEDAYFEDTIRHKVGLSIGGRGEFCYRDIEYMAIGVPFLRFQFQSQMLPGLIPNVHYISVDVPDDLYKDPHRDDMPDDKLGGEQHAKLLEQRFLEVKDDVDFLNFISRNARQYYETYLAPGQNVKYTLSLLNDFLTA